MYCNVIVTYYMKINQLGQFSVDTLNCELHPVVFSYSFSCTHSYVVDLCSCSHWDVNLWW